MVLETTYNDLRMLNPQSPGLIAAFTFSSKNVLESIDDSSVRSISYSMDVDLEASIEPL